MNRVILPVVGELVSVKVLSQYTQLKEDTIRHQIRRGMWGRMKKIGRTLYANRSDVEKKLSGKWTKCLLSE